jgi:hypothetical protein
VKDATAEKVQEVRLLGFPRVCIRILTNPFQAEESKRAAKKKAEEERVAKLSAEQQKKVMEKEKKKAMRKGTTRVRMG